MAHALVLDLKTAAEQCLKEGVNGWGNLMGEAADRLDAQAARIAELEAALSELLVECYKVDNEDGVDYSIDGHFLDNARAALAAK